VPKRNGASNVMVGIRCQRRGHRGKRWPIENSQRLSIRRHESDTPLAGCRHRPLAFRAEFLLPPPSWGNRCSAASVPGQADHAAGRGQPGCRHRCASVAGHAWDPYWASGYMLGAMATPVSPPRGSSLARGAPVIRERICGELGFLGIGLNQQRNPKNAPLILPDAERVKMRVSSTSTRTTLSLGPPSSISAQFGKRRP
jgi:hypothetical protein